MLKVIELFSGIGAQAAALENLNIEHEIIGISEINQNAINAYYKIHKKCPNLGDIKKIIELPKCDLLTYSFPCTDISSAGHKKELKKERKVVYSQKLKDFQRIVIRIINFQNIYFWRMLKLQFKRSS